MKRVVHAHVKALSRGACVLHKESPQAGPPYEKSCPGSFFFSLYGNCLSNSSAAFSSTKYPSGGAYSPVTPSRYPGISSLQRKNDASSPSSSP